MTETPCPPSNALQAKIDTGATIATTTFIDEMGRFAKRWEAVEVVAVVFEDGATFDLTRAEFKALQRATRELLMRQQSGPVPNPGASNA